MSAGGCHWDSGTVAPGAARLAEIDCQSNKRRLPRIEQFNLHSQRLFAATTRSYRKERAAGRTPISGRSPRAKAVGPIAEESIPGNAIADGAKSAATRASAQGNHLSLADEEALTITNGACADSLTDE
jgi:hypothetical protein